MRRVYYHGTTTNRVGSIMRHGLIPRKPSEHNYCEVVCGAQPQGVYLTDRDRAWHWAGWAVRLGASGRVAVLRVRLSPNAARGVTPDPMSESGVVAARRIPPTQIERVA